MVLDDAGVPGGVARGRRARFEGQQGRKATDGVEEVGPAQFLADGDGVDGLALAVQRADGVVDVAVSRLVEVGGAEADVDGAGDGIVAQQHGAKQRLLGFQVVGRDAAHAPLATPGVIDGLDHGCSLWSQRPGDR